MTLTMAKPEPVSRFEARRMAMSERRRRLNTRQAELERFWLNPPQKSGLERHHMQLTRELLTELVKPGMKVADLGCGDGELLEEIASPELQISAVDGSTNALKLAEARNLPGVAFSQAMLPCSSLPDKQFDLVLCCNLIAELDREEQRLMVSELTRLITEEGIVVVTSSLDTRTESPSRYLTTLLSTELSIDSIFCSYAGIQARYFPKSSRFYSILEQLGRLSPERNRDFMLIIAQKKPLES